MRVLASRSSHNFSGRCATRGDCRSNNAVNFLEGNLLARDRGSYGPHLDFRAAGFLRHIKQNLAAAQINGSRPFAHTKDRLLAETRDRFDESSLTSWMT